MDFVTGLLIGCAIGLLLIVLVVVFARANDGLASLDRGLPDCRPPQMPAKRHASIGCCAGCGRPWQVQRIITSAKQP